ncbi:MAG TPA: hypothetical protein VFZ66_22715 [Herpetosiphonaceae bacterium]
MELRYHICGYPVRVRDVYACSRTHPAFYDGARAWNEGPIASCPRCGQRLALDTLGEQPSGPASTLRMWQRDWVKLRQQLEALIEEQERHDPHFYPYHAEMELTEFENALRRIAELASSLKERPATHLPDPSADGVDRLASA